MLYCSSYVKEIYEAFALDTRAIEGHAFQASPNKLKQSIILKCKLYFGVVFGSYCGSRIKMQQYYTNQA